MVTEEEIIGYVPIYDKFGKRAKEIFLKNAYKKTFQKGSRLPLEYGGALIFVKKGNAYVFSVGENGEEIFIYRLQKENCTRIKAGLEYEFTMATELIVLDGAFLSVFISSSPSVENLLLKEEIKLQDNILNQLNMIMFGSIDARLSSFLLSVMQKNHGHALSLTHETIAKFIGSSREVITRKLKEYSDEGIIEKSRGKIIVKQKDALKKKCKI